MFLSLALCAVAGVPKNNDTKVKATTRLARRDDASEQLNNLS
jgi:hypothetical protein